MARTVEGGDFWVGQTESVLRALLHAAAIDGRAPATCTGGPSTRSPQGTP